MLDSMPRFRLIVWMYVGANRGMYAGTSANQIGGRSGFPAASYICARIQ